MIERYGTKIDGDSRSPLRTTLLGLALLFLLPCLAGPLVLAQEDSTSVLQAGDSLSDLRRIPTQSLLRSAQDNFLAGKWQAASARFEELVRRGVSPSRVPEVYVPLCESKLREGKFSEAESVAVITVRRTSHEATLERISFLRAEILYFSGDATRATDEYLLFLEQYPEGRLVNDAMERLLLIDENTGSSPGPLASYARAELLELAGMPDSALAVLTGLLADSPRAQIADDAVLRRGDVLRRLGRYSDALSEYRLLEVRFPMSHLVPVCKLRVATLYGEELRDGRKAIAEYEEIATRFPETSFAVEARSALEVLRSDSRKPD